MIHFGKHSDYHWLASEKELAHLSDLVLRYHPGYRLCITSFDSGPFQLGDFETEAGWTKQGDVCGGRRQRHCRFPE